jgi:response regulator RpfG family c-di-GMP phosphodiesterase
MEKVIFVIDDDLIYRMIITRMIGEIDNSVLIKECENGEIGILKMLNHGNTTDKMIVLLDINMPILDGWGFLEEIEKLNLNSQMNLAIYMVSSSIDESDLEKSKNYKLIQQFFSKPLERVDLKKIIGIA